MTNKNFLEMEDAANMFWSHQCCAREIQSMSAISIRWKMDHCYQLKDQINNHFSLCSAPENEKYFQFIAISIISIILPIAFYTTLINQRMPIHPHTPQANINPMKVGILERAKWLSEFIKLMEKRLGISLRDASE